MTPSTDRRRTAYYRPDVQGLNGGDPATRTLDPLDGKEYTYATTQPEVARAIAARHADFRVYRVHSTGPSKLTPTLPRTTLVNCSSGLPGGRSWMSSMRKKNDLVDML